MNRPKKLSQKQLLTLSALGVVYGDIGTSPLYAFRECFYGEHATLASPENILGILSLIFWSLILIISIKYLFIVLKADHYGEGGVLALMQSAISKDSKSKFRRGFILTIGLFGAALLYGDGVLTPAISVLSAVEGLELIAPSFDAWVLPIAIIILIGLFAMQHFGTAKVGLLFGPVMILWFILLGGLGIAQIIKAPVVLTAINPLFALRFLLLEGAKSLFVLGAVFLVVTGGEALYADLGHFGKSAIRRAWFFVVLPGLLLNYFGQGALVLTEPAALENPFYHLVSGWWLYPLVLFSTVATIIASQAIISGAFSLTYQAIQLHYLPRLKIIHTSDTERGQVYLPQINALLLLLTIIVVLLFQSSANLAIAYGIAITVTMIITDLLLFFVMRDRWHWPMVMSTGIVILFLVVDAGFFAANSLKIIQGGWFPLVIALFIFLIFRTWIKGREKLSKQLKPYRQALSEFVLQFNRENYLAARNTAIYLNSDNAHTPSALLHNLEHNQVIHRKVLFLQIIFSTRPRVSAKNRMAVEDLGNGFFRVNMNYGYMEKVSISSILQLWQSHDLLEKEDLNDLTFFISREHVIFPRTKGLQGIRNRLFRILQQIHQGDTTYFGLPSKNVFEVGRQLEINL